MRPMFSHVSFLKGESSMLQQQSGGISGSLIVSQLNFGTISILYQCVSEERTDLDGRCGRKSSER